jgi:acetate kinase
VVACFDTAFHSTVPDAAAVYPVPWEWTQRWGVRRYGFHGLSHAWAMRRAAELLERPVDSLRMVTCHLGAGASLAAVQAGVSIDTTMGFTPMEGMMMATRSGSVDPGIIIWMQRWAGLDVVEVERGLDRESGLLGVSGISGDIRPVLAAAGWGEERAVLALDIYVHRLRAGVATMAAALDGLDALVFTGGIGEHVAEIRERTCAGLRFLGLTGGLTTPAPGHDALVSGPGAPTAVLVVRAREDLQIAHEVRTVLAASDRNS